MSSLKYYDAEAMQCLSFMLVSLTDRVTEADHFESDAVILWDFTRFELVKQLQQHSMPQQQHNYWWNISGFLEEHSFLWTGCIMVDAVVVTS